MPASAARLTPIAAAVDGLAPATPAGAACCGSGVDAQQRQRGVEAERLGERVAGDVEHDAGDRERGAEPDPERDHPHVLEARVGEQPLPRQRPPKERHRDEHRRQPERDEHRARRAGPDRRLEGLLDPPGDQQHASAAAPRESIALIGGGASLCASGSQLWTGAQPIFVASPASSSTNAISVEPFGQRVGGEAERVPVERARARGGRRSPG